MAKGGGGKGGGGKGGGGGKAAAAPAPAAPARAAAPAPVASVARAAAPVAAPAQTKKQVKQEAKAVKRETKTAQKTVAQATKQVKKQGEIANLAAYNQALSVLQQTKPKAAVKATTKLGKAETKATAKGLIPRPVATSAASVSSSADFYPQEEPDFDFKSYYEDLLGRQGSEFQDQLGALNSEFQGQLSQYQDLLSQMSSQRGEQDSSSFGSVQSEAFKPFDPDLFTNLLGQVQGGSSMKQREQLQDFKEKDEARDYAQALKAYKF